MAYKLGVHRILRLVMWTGAVACLLALGSRGGRNCRPQACGSASDAPQDRLALASKRPGLQRSGSERFASVRQVSTGVVFLQELGLPEDLQRSFPGRLLPREIAGRRIPTLTPESEWLSPRLVARAVPLPEANTLSHVHYQRLDLGRLVGEDGGIRLFNPEILLVKFRKQAHVAALRIEPARELDALRTVAGRPDVEFAELDTFERRAFLPNDPFVTNQWHHRVLGSAMAWERSLGSGTVRIAIVDTPFQMNHSDLAANVDAGWDVVENQPVTANTGVEHSTLGAGLAAAVIGNQSGVAGMGNCRLVPININGAASEMYNAVVWAADHDIRVVNISWTGADSDTVNTAGAYLRTTARGVLFMAGVNGSGFLNYPNQPDIYCVALTDEADNLQSKYGYHINFTAPGWNLLSTTTGGSYGSGTGTSYATPIVAGVAAVLMSINPTLDAEAVIDLLKTTAVDKGPTGWDIFFGWGRIDFAAAAAAARATLPVILRLSVADQEVLITSRYQPGATHSLWRAGDFMPGTWTRVTNAILSTNGEDLVWRDRPPAGKTQFYRVGLGFP